MQRKRFVYHGGFGGTRIGEMNITLAQVVLKNLIYSQTITFTNRFLLWAKSVDVLPKSLLGKAVNYLLEQWVYLKNVYLDGRLEISNNRAERSIKSFVTHRKAWLFANTVDGAKSSAVIYSIAESAKENSLRPFEYFVWLLKTIPGTTTGKIDELLPGSPKIPNYCRMPDIAKD